MPTAYLSPSLLQDLTNVSVAPGAGNTGYPMVWNNTTGRFELAVLGVAGGGTGTSNGSITGTGALTFAAGGTNQNVTLTPSGSGKVVIPSVLEVSNNFAVNPENVLAKLIQNGDAGVFDVATYRNASGQCSWRTFYSRGSLSQPQDLLNGDLIGDFEWFGRNNATFRQVVNLNISVNGTPGSGFLPADINFNTDSSGFAYLPSMTRFSILSTGVCRFHSTTESTSTTTGAVRIDGGLGVASNVNIGGNLRFAGGTVPATATSAGTTGDIRYDGSHLYICTATNTWVRTALSTW